MEYPRDPLDPPIHLLQPTTSRRRVGYNIINMLGISILAISEYIIKMPSTQVDGNTREVEKEGKKGRKTLTFLINLMQEYFVILIRFLCPILNLV